MHGDQSDFVHTNYAMAAGRIGLAILLVPLLWGLGALFLLDPAGSPAVAVVLFSLSLPFLWYAATVPISLRVGQEVRVRYLLGVVHIRHDEVEGLESGSIRTTFGPGRLLPWWELGIRSVPTATLRTVDGRRICFSANVPETEAMRHRLSSAAAASSR